MCGIAGIIRFDGRAPEKHRLDAMNGAMAHRGPDGEGVWNEDGVALAHRRLAIIDLATGDQPMFNEDGNVLTVFNGEIYNFLDVKPELAKRGHAFKTNSDTEVIVHGFEEWGADLPRHLNGMFAFAAFDRRAKKVLLARDRLGVKPLYWWRGPDAIVFASEMGALLASGLVPRELDREALELYLHYQYIPAPLTIYRGVRKLEPAQALLVDLKSRETSLSTYWDLDRERAPEEGVSPAEWKERLRSVLDDAVRIRLISDVPFGAFLSGGTDSGIVTAMMARRMNEPVRTFSIGLADTDQDELSRARRVAKRFGTAHEELRVSPEGLTLIPKLAEHFGEPFADSSAIPTWYVSKIARERVKMVLTGDGGDEMFAGYRRYPHLAGTTADGLPRAKPLPVTAGDRARGLLRSARRAAVVTKRTLLRQPIAPAMRAESWVDRYDRAMSHFSADERRALLGEGPLTPADHFTSRFAYPAADSVVTAAQYCDLKSYLPGDVLAKVDRMSMANSLEVRSPLLDYRIGELAFRMPTSMKLRDVRDDAANAKWILKELASEYLGRDYVYAPKEGFGIPIDRWLREDRDGYLRDSLLSGESPAFGAIDRDAARRFVKEHLEGTRDHAYKVWNLLMLDAWFRSVHAVSRAAA